MAEDEEEVEDSKEIVIRVFKIGLPIVLLIALIAVAHIYSKNKKNHREAEAEALYLKAKDYSDSGLFFNAEDILGKIQNNYPGTAAARKAPYLLREVNRLYNEKNPPQGPAIELIRGIQQAEKEKLQKEEKREQDLRRLMQTDPPAYYKNVYGKPDNEDEFHSGSYWTITYTWYCVEGKYRSITFKYNNGMWKVDSRYTTDCIK